MDEERDINKLYPCPKCGFIKFFYDNYCQSWHCKACNYIETPKEENKQGTPEDIAPQA
jgi:rubredoxin